jgi:Fungal tRNA ligase phosphodiesterase domain
VTVIDRIACALVKIEHEGVMSQNEFAHVTLMKGKWKPVQSNDILKVLFDQSHGLKKDMYGALMG